MLFLQIVAGAVLIGMAWQDFKFRAVYWWLFLLLFVVLGQVKLLAANWPLLLNDLGYNVTFVGLQLICLSIYFSIKARHWVNLFNGYFGLGDLLFLLSIAVYFSFFNYILFYLSSLLICVLGSLLVAVFKSDFKTSIPLAGMQAILFGLFMGFEYFDAKITFTSDLGLLYYFGF